MPAWYSLPAAQLAWKNEGCAVAAVMIGNAGTTNRDKPCVAPDEWGLKPQPLAVV